MMQLQQQQQQQQQQKQHIVYSMINSATDAELCMHWLKMICKKNNKCFFLRAIRSL